MPVRTTTMRRVGLAAVAGLALLLTACSGSGHGTQPAAPATSAAGARITDKAAFERALQVTTSRPVVGAWYWDYPCNMAVTCAYFRPRDYWPAGTTVSFTGHLDGVRGAPGLYGAHTLTQTFDIGAS